MGFGHVDDFSSLEAFHELELVQRRFTHIHRHTLTGEIGRCDGFEDSRVFINDAFERETSTASEHVLILSRDEPHIYTEKTTTAGLCIIEITYIREYFFSI